MTEPSDIEIRMKACEIATNYSAHMTAAMVAHHGLPFLKEMAPLALVSEFEDYIRYGKIPEPHTIEKI